MGSSGSAIPPFNERKGIVAVSGLRREAGLLARYDVHRIVGGGVISLLDQRLRAIPHQSIGCVISIGLCAALDMELQVGDCVIASEVVAGAARYGVDAPWMQRLMARLPDATVGTIAGTDSILVAAAQKKILQRTMNAIAADMESHVAAQFAAGREIPFAALRVVSDDARHTLPPAVRTAMKPDGGVDVPAVLGSVLREPFQLPQLVRTAWTSEIAFRALVRCLNRLGPKLMGPDFR